MELKEYHSCSDICLFNSSQRLVLSTVFRERASVNDQRSQHSLASECHVRLCRPLRHHPTPPYDGNRRRRLRIPIWKDSRGIASLPVSASIRRADPTGNAHDVKVERKFDEVFCSSLWIWISQLLRQKIRRTGISFLTNTVTMISIHLLKSQDLLAINL